MEKTKWSENVILVDADYVDAVAFNLIVNFERMLNRPIPKADLAQWLVCAALDGGVGEGKNDIQVVFIHGKGRKALDNFTPSDFEAELDGKAFCDGHLGEFKLSSVQVENLVDGDALYLQSLEALADEKGIKRLVIVPRDFGPDRRQGHHVAGHGTSGGERIPSGDSRLLVDECVGHQGRRNLRLSENRPNLFESAEREQII